MAQLSAMPRDLVAPAGPMNTAREAQHARGLAARVRARPADSRSATRHGFADARGSEPVDIAESAGGGFVKHRDGVGGEQLALAPSARKKRPRLRASHRVRCG
ncbi:MAG: hypothetical protein WBV82_03290, partial [Myxococcaceae bacterium]